jgi:hypothetical protein
MTIVKKLKKMSKQNSESSLPPLPKEFTMPFYYSSLTNCCVFYLVDPQVILPYTENKGVKPAIFNCQGVVSFNYQLYTSQFPDGANIVKEIELNIIAYAESEENKVPTVSFEEFVLGDEQSKILGNLRLHVPCDNDIAIEAGIKLFNEPKFKTQFTTNLPSLNVSDVKTWHFTCHDPQDFNNKIYSCDVDLQNLYPVAGNCSPITQYGTYDGKLIAARWNILQPFATYFLKDEEKNRVQIEYGNSSHPMRKDLEILIGNNAAAAVQTLNSPPIAIQSRAYYI